MKWEVSNIILERLINSSSYIVYGKDKIEALENYIDEIINTLGTFTDTDLCRIAHESDDCIYEPIVMRIQKDNK